MMVGGITNFIQKGQMMKKKIIALVLFPTFTAFSVGNVDLDKVAKERAEWTKQHFAKQAAPAPDGGVTVVPEQQMSEYNKFKEQREKERADVRNYGYIKQFLPQTQSLLNFKEISKNQFKSKPLAATDEGLRHNISEVEMAYEFHGVPSSAVSTILGVAPSVTYVKGLGWAGAMQFFEKSGLGICSYRENNLKYSHGAAVIAEEDVTKDINGKVTVANVTGEPNSGFMYSIDWYDNNYFRELKCANQNFNNSIMTSTLALALAIDNNS